MRSSRAHAILAAVESRYREMGASEIPGDYLSELGYSSIVDAYLLEKCLDQQRISPADVNELLEVAAVNGETLAQAALDKKLISSAELLEIRAEIDKMEVVELHDEIVEEDIARLLESKFALDWKILPYSRNSAGNLLIAISDPEDIEARDKAKQFFSNEEIVFHLVEADSLTMYINRIFDVAREQLTETMKSETDVPVEKYRIDDDSESSIKQLVDDVINDAYDRKASDIHVESRQDQTVIRYRVDGELEQVAEIRKEWAENIVARIKTMAGMATDERRVPQDGRIRQRLRDGGNLDLRVNTLPTVSTEPGRRPERVTARLLDPKNATMALSDLGMSPENLERYKKATKKPHGVALVTGPTGSGKSTTMYSSLREALDPTLNLISVEDPVEYFFDGVSQVDVSGGDMVSDEKGRLGFANALRAILRSDPDVIMIGEIRDHETAQIAVDAALTGHFLYSTLHTNDALASVTRLGELQIESWLVAEAIEVLVSQRLIRRLCPACKEPHEVDADTLRSINAPADAIKWVEEHGSKTLYRRPREQNNCSACRGKGYRGRTAIHEVVALNPELREAIVKREPLSRLTQIARNHGMKSLYYDAFLRVWAGETSVEEALLVAST